MKHFDLSVITILDPIPRIYSEKIDLLGNLNNVISSYGVVFFSLPQVYPKKYKLRLLSNRTGAPVLSYFHS